MCLLTQAIGSAVHLKLPARFLGLATLGQVDGVETELSSRLPIGADITPHRAVVKPALRQDLASLGWQLPAVFRTQACLPGELEGVGRPPLFVLALPEEFGEDKPGLPHLAKQAVDAHPLLLLEEAETRVGTVLAHPRGVEALVDGLQGVCDFDARVVPGLLEYPLDHARRQHLDQDELGLEQEYGSTLLRVSALSGQTFHFGCLICHGDLLGQVVVVVVANCEGKL